MANKRVNFSIKASSTVVDYWITAGGRDVVVIDGKGHVLLTENERHMLVYWFEGAPKGKLSIEGKVGGEKVVNVKESRIPEGEYQNAGARRFSL